MLLPQLLRMTILEALRQNMIASNFIASTEFDDMDFINRELSLFLKLFIPLQVYINLIEAVIGEAQKLLDHYRNQLSMRGQGQARRR
jgi:hypothetical protein